MCNVCHVYDDVGLFFNHIASWRLRVDIPKSGLKKLGIHSYSSVTPDLNAVNIYHKHFAQSSPDWIAMTGGIYDIVDDHFDLEDADYYKRMCDIAPVITCSTNGMKERIHNATHREAVVIQDPYDNTQYKARFGSETNLLYLRDMKIPCKGDLVTHSGLQAFALKDLKEVIKQGWNYIPWVNGIMPNIFKRHDVVVIPYGDSAKQHAKSPNRIVDSLRSGKIVVTNDTPVVDTYGLRDFCVVDNSIADGIRFVWNNPEKAIRKVFAGQGYIEKHLSPDVIAKQWAKVIKTQC
jgi:glycosyltransferase involved in cell wall biosynthesis